MIIFSPQAVTRYPLPPIGRLRIGRSHSVEIRIKDSVLSRVHAVLEIDARGTPEAPSLRITDLNSSNGTCLRGNRLKPQESYTFVVGDVVELGQVTLIVQRTQTCEQPRRLWTHGHFTLRLEDECVRSRTEKTRFALLRIRVEDHLDGTGTRVLEDAIASLLGPRDLIAIYAPGEYDILLPAAQVPSPEEVTQISLAKGLGIQRGLRRFGLVAHVGISIFPDHGQTPESLITHACSSVRVTEKRSDAVFVIEDPIMKQLYQIAERVARTELSVLILGETGVGKELLAKAIHERSPRSQQAFLALNCGAFSESLIESELFGHERGAFTGAVKAKKGLLEAAKGGTVFLDEIGDLPMVTQVKFLRVLEERRIRRVGGEHSLPIDVRFISATNRNLEQGIRQGTFREDLFYRLNGMPLVIPSLRERPGEIELLTKTFAREASARMGQAGEPFITPDALSILKRYSWPGNIRELKNLIERAVVLADSAPIDCEHLPLEKLSAPLLRATPTESRVGLVFKEPDPSEPPNAVSDAGCSPTWLGLEAPSDHGGGLNLESTTEEMPVFDPAAFHLNEVETAPPKAEPHFTEKMKELDRQRILQALEQCSGNQTRAAEFLGMSRTAFVSRLDAHNIPRPRKRTSPSR